MQQERTKGDGENQAEILGPVTREHFEGDEIHDSPPSLKNRWILENLAHFSQSGLQ